MEVLKFNSKGVLVEYVQSLLNTLGFSNLNIDGIFGSKTKEAVINFQRNFWLTPDGIIWKNTWNKLLLYAYIVPTNIHYGYNILSINLDGFKQKFPFLDIGNIGYSSLGRTIPYIRFGKGKKQVFYSASIHANEWITSVLLMKYIENLSFAYENNTTIFDYRARFLYDNISLYIVPMVNPDGVDLVVGNIEKYLPNIFNNAKILSDNYPNIPFPDGWKANINGIDLNLQFPALWNEAKEIKYSQGYTKPGPRDFVGKSPLIAVESINLYNFTISKNFNLILAYHTQGRVIYWRFSDFLPANSYYIGTQFQNVSGYALEDTPKNSANAGYKDWFIKSYNRPGYTIEAGYGTNPLPISQFDEIYSTNVGILTLGMVL